MAVEVEAARKARNSGSGLPLRRRRHAEGECLSAQRHARGDFGENLERAAAFRRDTRDRRNSAARDRHVTEVDPKSTPTKLLDMSKLASR